MKDVIKVKNFTNHYNGHVSTHVMCNDSIAGSLYKADDKIRMQLFILDDLVVNDELESNNIDYKKLRREFIKEAKDFIDLFTINDLVDNI